MGVSKSVRVGDGGRFQGNRYGSGAVAASLSGRELVIPSSATVIMFDKGRCLELETQTGGSQLSVARLTAHYKEKKCILALPAREFPGF